MVKVGWGALLGKFKVLGGRRSSIALGWAALLTVSVIAAAPASAADVVPPTGSLLVQRSADVVTSDPIPTVQIDDGYVWAQTTIGSTVFAVGDFDNAREASTGTGGARTARANALAYDIQSGELLPFAPQVNGAIKAVAASADGERVYIGGSFTSVNGEDRWNFAALDATTGELIPEVAPIVGGTGVYAIAVDGPNIYLGGSFTQVNGSGRKNLAAIDDQTATLATWAPQTDHQVDAMVMDPAGAKVIVGGRFSEVNGNSSIGGIAALDKTSGALDERWGVSRTINNSDATGRAGIFSLAVDASGVYGTGWSYSVPGTVQLEGAFAAEAGTGEVRWISDCLGDSYGVYSTGDVVYTTNHMHSCETMGMQKAQSTETYRHSAAFTADARGTLGTQTNSRFQDWGGAPAPAQYAWNPTWSIGDSTGLSQAGLSITGAGDMISIGGEFVSVNGGEFAGLVRFSTSPPDGAKDGPRLADAQWVPTAESSGPGQVAVSIPGNWDRDDLTLTYDLWRSGTDTPIDSVSADGTEWDQTAIVLNDRFARLGMQEEYTVTATDAAGNSVTSAPTTVTGRGR